MRSNTCFDLVVIDGATVRLVVRDLGEVFGDALPRLRDGRRPISVWGCSRTLCIGPEDVELAERVDVPRERVIEIAERQRRRWPEGSSMRRRADR